MTSGTASARFDAIGTTVTVVVTDAAALQEATEIVRSQVAALDAAASRFRDDSELAMLHARAGHPVEVSSLLLGAVEEALWAAKVTGGLVSPTVGEALELYGYDRDFATMAPSGSAVHVRCRRIPGWQRVRVDRSAQTVTVPVGVRVDLGATAKAGCADRAARRVTVHAGCGTLVDIGGDLAVAGPAPAGGWMIRVADRHDAPVEAPGVVVGLRDGGMATSGTAARRWQRGGRTLHHIIDPATGAPAAAPFKTVTVVAGNCLAANTASTASIVLGSAAPAWLAERGLHARLVAEGGQVVITGQWPGDTGGALLPEPPAW